MRLVFACVWCIVSMCVFRMHASVIVVVVEECDMFEYVGCVHVFVYQENFV